MAKVTIPKGTNWVVNPSAEVNTNGWFSSGIAVARGVLASRAYKGTCFFIGALTVATGIPYVALSRNLTGVSAVPAKEGDSIQTRMYVSTTTPGLVVRLQLQTSNSANGVLDTTYSEPIALTTDWQPLISETMTAGPNTAFYSVMIRVEVNGWAGLPGARVAAVSDNVYWDAVETRINEPLDVRYLDGDQGPQYRWLGTPHMSVSVRDEYTYKAQSPAQRGKTRISAELWRYTLSGEPIEEITALAMDAKITMNSNADIKGTMSVKVRAQDRITPFVDHLAPFIIIENAEGEITRHQMGLYAIPPSKESHTSAGSIATLEGRDVTWYLANSYPANIVNIGATDNIIETVRDVCTSHGLTVNIPASTKTLGKARTYHPDKSWLQIVNDLLNGIGYYTLWADLSGAVRSRPYFELAGAQPTLELYSGEGSMVINAIEQEGTYEGLANRITVYKANTEGSPIISIKTNNDPVSPISTVSTGRVLNRLVTDSNIADQATADALAKRLLEESASYTKKLKITTLPLPARDLHEVYDLAIYNDHGEVIGFGKWWCDQWEMPISFRPVNATMTHHVKRLEPYGGDSV